MEKSKLSQLVTEILSYAKERYGSIVTPDAATVVCAAATLLSSDGSYNTTDEDDQKKLVRKLVELSSDNVEPTLKKDQDDPDSVEATLVTRYTTKGVINQLNAAWSDLKQAIDHVYDIESGILNDMPFDVFPSLLFGDRMKQYALNVINCLWETPEVKEAQHKATEIYAKEEASDLLEWRLNKYKETVKKWADFTASKFEKRYKDETQFLKLWNILHTTKCSIFVQNVDPVFKPKDMPVKNLETGEIVTPEEALRSIKEHQFSPSFVANESILSISTSNPGVAGDINPFAQIDEDGCFDESKMPWGDHLPPIPTKEEFEKNLPAYKDVKPFHEVLHDLKPDNTKREKLTKAEQIEFKIKHLKELERKYSDMWKATINDPDGVEESEPFLDKQEEIGEQIVKLEQKLKELKKNQN